MPAKRDSLIEIKGAMLPVLSVILRSLDLAEVRAAAGEMFGDAAFFDGDLAALDLSLIDAGSTAEPDWSGLGELFAGHGLRVIGIRGGTPELVASAGQAGLPPLPIADAPTRPQAKQESVTPPTPEAAPPQAPAPSEAAPPVPQAPAVSPTIIIDRPLRSGQQVYARGGDVIVLAAVSTGAEVIADGSIHVYAPLRGRALAGASGDTRARILTTRMEAELVSVAGIYRTFEDGVPAQLLGKPTQIRLIEDNADGNPRLVVEPLPIG